LGSPVYAAPEQLRSSRDVDHRVDIWSLGVILYECTTGAPPFAAPTLAQLCTQILQDAPLPPSAHRADLPRAFSDAVMRCLEKDESTRFQSVDELVGALARYAPEAAARCLSYLARLPAQAQTAQGVERAISSPAAGATLTDSVRCDTELSVERAKPRRQGLNGAIGALAVGAVVLGAWLLGRASGGHGPQSVSAAASLTQPGPVSTSNVPSISSGIMPPATSAEAASPQSAPTGSAAARAPSSTRTKPKTKQGDVRPATGATAPWVEAR
jgi:serine/threonine-protein kinase